MSCLLIRVRSDYSLTCNNTPFVPSQTLELGKNVLSTRNLNSTRVRLRAEVDDLQVINNEGITTGPLTKAHGGEISDAADTLGELEVEVGSEDDFVFGLVLDTPSGHDEGVVLSENNDLVNTLGLEVLSMLDVRRNVVDVARGCKLQIRGSRVVSETFGEKVNV